MYVSSVLFLCSLNVVNNYPIRGWHFKVFVIYTQENLIGTLLAIFGNLLVSISVSIQVNVYLQIHISNCIVIQGVFMLRPVRWESNAFIYFSTSCSIAQLLFVAVSKGVGLTRRCKRQTHVITTDVFSCRNKVMWCWQEIKTRGNITTLRPGGLAWCWWFWGRPPCLCLTRLHRSRS